MRIRLMLAAFVLGFFALSSAGVATTVHITINKVSQKMTVKVDGETEYVWPVSTGARGYETPSGKYRPFRMEKDHFSKEWDDAPMPNSIFFTPRGHAIHGSMYVKSLGRRASHGCVRLAPDNAAKLYSLVQKAGMQNTTVVLRGGFFDGSFNDSFAQLEYDVKKTTKTLQKKAKRRLFLLGQTLDRSF
ncbi:MAG TPA: L,D-transpeptidase [Aestuariivirga sp.]|nr:L,D-transpeptidase [Aestuariivirga sp.]